MGDTVVLDRPIFLIGCAKSGTTLLSLLMSMHPEIGPVAPGQNQSDRQEYIDSLFHSKIFDAISQTIEKRDIWESYFPCDTSLRMGKERILYKNPLTRSQTLSLVSDLTADFVEKRFLNKEPPNSFRVHVLRDIFPDCKFVAIHRDGRDVIASWGSKKGHSWEKYGGYESAIRLFGRKWDETIDHIEAHKNEFDILTIHYEDLVGDLHTQLSAIFEHCELTDNSEIYEVLKSRPAVGRWVELISTEFHHLVNTVTARNRNALGYDNNETSLPKNVPVAFGPADTFEDYFAKSPKIIHPCPICNRTDFSTLAQVDRHNLGLSTAICQNCGLVMNNPRPHKNWYETFYRDWFWSVYIGRDYKDLNALYVSDHQGHKGKVLGEMILDEFGRKDRTVSYLDIGCGLGGLVRYINSERPNWSTTGIDPSLSAIEFVKREAPNVISHRQSLENIEALGKGQIDLISMIHVLEHVDDPVRTLRQVRGALRADGLVYIEVPDFHSPNWKGKDFLHIAHTYIFDRQTLDFALRAAGLVAQKYVNSPVHKHWSWATGVFAKPAIKENSKELTFKVSPESICDKKEWMANKLGIQEQANSGLWRRIGRKIQRSRC